LREEEIRARKLAAEEAKAAKQAERQVQNELRQARNNKAKRNSIMVNLEKGGFEDCGVSRLLVDLSDHKNVPQRLHDYEL
jgi:1,2-phenylacetyl-CoA epoxidase catalytic subunit